VRFTFETYLTETFFVVRYIFEPSHETCPVAAYVVVRFTFEPYLTETYFVVRYTFEPSRETCLVAACFVVRPTFGTCRRRHGV